MKTIQEQRLEFINETAAHFNLNNRAIRGNDVCVYSHQFNGGCAIGRHLTAELADNLDANFTSTGSPAGVHAVWTYLPAELTALGEGFLAAAQAFHDQPENWNASGLTTGGHLALANIIKAYCRPDSN